MRTERLTFPGAFGDMLAAKLERPDDREPTAWTLFAHCFTCNKDFKAVTRISRALTDRGFGLMRFDFTGLGESQGSFVKTNFSSNIEDLRASIAFLSERGLPPSLLIGHSLGGAASLVVASEFEQVRAVATIAAPCDTHHLRQHLLTQAPTLMEQSESDVNIGGRIYRIRRQLLEDLREDRILPAVRKLKKPLLILHSPTDDTVDISNARQLFQAAEHPKSFISLDNIDHLLAKQPADAKYVAEILAVWAKRYLE